MAGCSRVLTLVAWAAMSLQLLGTQGRTLLDTVTDEQKQAAQELSVNDAAWSLAALASKYPLMVQFYKPAIVDALANAANACHPSLKPHMALLYARNLGYLGDYFCALHTPEEQIARLGIMIQQDFAHTRNTVFWALPDDEKPSFVTNSGEVWPAVCNLDFNKVVEATLTLHLGNQGFICVPSTGN